MLRDVFPILSRPHGFNAAKRDSVTRSKYFSAFARYSYSPNRIFGEYGQAVSFPNMRCKIVSFFLHHIFCVISKRADKKMTGSNATSIVTFMQYVKSCWYKSFIQFVRKTVRENFKIKSVSKHSISFIIKTVLPVPTTISNSYKIPKPAFYATVLASFISRKLCFAQNTYFWNQVRRSHIITVLFTCSLCSMAQAQFIRQSGNVTPGHSLCWAIDGVAYDCGIPGGGVSVVGSTTTNDFVAFNSSGSLIDSGINPANTSAISGLWNFNGGATAPTRTTGDNTTNIATTAFVNASLTAAFTTGTTAPLTDGQVLLVTNNAAKTALSIYQPFSNPSQSQIYDAGRFVLDLESVSGGDITQANALSGYIYNNVPLGMAPATGNAVAVYGLAVGAVNGASSWGSNFYCSDNPTTATYVGSLATPRSCIGSEIDVRIQDSNGTALATGVLISLVSSGGTSYQRGFAVDIESLDLLWSFGINCGSGAVSIACLNIGAQAISGTSVASQALAWEYFNGAAVNKAMTMKAAGSGGFVFATTDTSITNAMDWSGVTITGCALDFSFGCVLNSGGAAQFTAAGIATSAVAAAALSVQGPGSTSADFSARFYNSTPTLVASFRDDGAVFLFGPISMTDSTASTSPSTGAIVNPGGLGVAGNTFLGGKLSVGGQIISTFGATTIASGACGTGTNGSVSGTNQAGLITIGAAGTTTCTVSFSTTITAPNACIVTQSGGTAELTKVTSVSSSNFVVAGATMASTSYYYICI